MGAVAERLRPGKKGPVRRAHSGCVHLRFHLLDPVCIRLVQVLVAAPQHAFQLVETDQGDLLR
ncbi:hypothetical protein GCM10027348_42690 [Hymenobacter tenuis]